MKDKYQSLKDTLKAFGARFTVSKDPEHTPIPETASLNEVIDMLAAGLKLGQNIHPPVQVMAGERFICTQIRLTDQANGNSQPATRLSVSLYTDLSDKMVQVDQALVGYGVMCAAVAAFVANVKAEQLANKVESMPT